ncbi:MAG: hypothetical protein ABR518_04750 [Actinomycetota bacterium]
MEPTGHDAPVPIAELPWEDAWLLAGQLLSAGIDAIVYPPDPPTPNAYGPALRIGARHRHQVLVYEADVDDARAIVAAMEAE